MSKEIRNLLLGVLIGGIMSLGSIGIYKLFGGTHKEHVESHTPGPRLTDIPDELNLTRYQDAKKLAGYAISKKYAVAKNRVFAVNVDYLQTAMTGLKSTQDLYFSIGADGVLATSRARLIISRGMPDGKDQNFYNIGNAICPEPTGCDFP